MAEWRPSTVGSELMSASAFSLFQLLRNMLLLEGSERSLAVDALTDYLDALSSQEAQVFAQVILWMVTYEANAEALEAELHALAELAEAGLIDREALGQLHSVQRSRLMGSSLEHFDYLIGLLKLSRDQ